MYQSLGMASATGRDRNPMLTTLPPNSPLRRHNYAAYDDARVAVR
jgi:hypothetical protein